MRRVIITILLLCASVGLAAGACDSGWKSFKDACYYTVIGYSAYGDAQKYCNSKDAGAFVVTIHSPEEKEFVQGLFESPRRGIWIGLTGGSSWQWIDNITLGYTNWRSSAPRSTSGQCIMASPDDAKWDMVDCANRVLYQGVVCKKNETKAAPVACTSNKECKGSELCSAGFCKLTEELTPCSSGCPAGHECEFGRCVAPYNCPAPTENGPYLRLLHTTRLIMKPPTGYAVKECNCGADGTLTYSNALDGGTNPDSYRDRFVQFEPNACAAGEMQCFCSTTECWEIKTVAGNSVPLIPYIPEGSSGVWQWILDLTISRRLDAEFIMKCSTPPCSTVVSKAAQTASRNMSHTCLFPRISIVGCAADCKTLLDPALSCTLQK